MQLVIDLSGERVEPDRFPFTIGRDADLVVDDNPYLHRHFLQVYVAADGVPMLANIGSQLVAAVADPDGRMEAMLGPGAALPIVHGDTVVRFAAGPTQYEFTLERGGTPPVPELAEPAGESPETVGRIELTPDQTRLVLSIAESALRSGGTAAAQIPTGAEAARRLGWKVTKYNRKLDNVCEKLSALGVRGLHGDTGSHASNRRARLVEYVLASRIVTKDDLWMLDGDQPDEAP